MKNLTSDAQILDENEYEDTEDMKKVDDRMSNNIIEFDLQKSKAEWQIVIPIGLAIILFLVAFIIFTCNIKRIMTIFRQENNIESQDVIGVSEIISKAYLVIFIR